MTYAKLVEIIEPEKCQVFSKVRVADVLPLNNSGVVSDYFSFALKSHFDFVVTDEATEPLFIVEFDGPTHDSQIQKHRDFIKNQLCARFGMQLLRIKDSYLTREFREKTLLRYFVECWFLDKAFSEAREAGALPSEEGFDPTWIVSDGRSKNTFPFWVSYDVQQAIRRLHKQGRITDDYISYWIGSDTAGTYRCLAWLQCSPGNYMIVKTGMRSQLFPVSESDILSQLAIFDIYELVKPDSPHKCAMRTDAELKHLIGDCESRFELRASHSSTRLVKAL